MITPSASNDNHSFLAPVRVRYAPSPTGSPHIGNIRTALFNWLLARHTGGQFILRIEDTDQNRLVPEALGSIFESLRWLGLDWDEGPEKGGSVGPYFQSERLDLYRQMTEKLIEDDHAYHCFCSAERIAEARLAQEARKETIRYDRACRNLPLAQARARKAAGEGCVVRFKTPLEGRTTVDDLFRGEISFDNAILDDHILLKSDGWPTYQLANVVDDHLMGITHVLRGDEWISSTPKHVLEYAAFGWQPPLFGHFALILGKDRSKLSKRHGATDVLSYRRAGYLPQALVNFMALLGWSPPPRVEGEAEAEDSNDEILSRDELIRHFTLDRIGVTPSIFDTEKLDWVNGHYIRRLAPETLAQEIAPFLKAAGLIGKVEGDKDKELEYLGQIVPLIRERLKLLTEAPDLVRPFFEEPAGYDPRMLVQKGSDLARTKVALLAARSRLGAIEFSEGSLEETLRGLTEELGVKTSQLFGAIRVAVTGRTVAPPLFGTLVVLGKERSLARIDRALQALG